jgi:ATP-dependent helicase/DNAse subunit B
MTTNLIIAPPAAGKTATCIDRILAIHKEKPLAQVWVVVPNPQKAAYFKKRLAEAGGSMNVRVGVFHNFYKEILAENGSFVPVITPALSYRLIQETVDETYSAGELKHYAAIKDKPGFVSVLRDAFAELRSATVRPSAFLEYTRDASLARSELAILYNRFLARQEMLGWVDTEGQAWQAIEALEHNPSIASRLSLVIADGFTSFTASQRRFLNQLSHKAGELYVTLTGEVGSTRQVDGRSLGVLADLEKDLSPKIVELKDPPGLPKNALHMQRYVFETGEVQQLDVLRPFMLEVRSQADEAREALRWIKQLHVREQVPLGACAIYTANIEIYQPLLRSVAEEFGIKVHFSQVDPLSESPVVLALLSLLLLPLEDYPTRALFNTLRSPYFDFGLEPKDIEILENTSQQAIIVSGKEQWDEAWLMLQRSQKDAEEHPDEERQRKNLVPGIHFSDLWTRFDRFWQLFAQIDLARSQTAWVAWLENTLNGLSFYEKVFSERDSQACESLGEALRALILSESVAGTKVVDYAQFIADLQGTLAGTPVQESREARRDAVFVGKMVEARGARYEAVALLGLSEGLFPVVENPDPFLDEALRKDLGLEPRLGRHQASTFYQAFTRADTHLLLTRPYLTDEGENWEPSIFWESTKKLFSKSAIMKLSPSKPLVQADAASTQELLFWAVQQQNLQYSQDAELSKRWQGLQKSHRILDARRAKRAQGVFEGSLLHLRDQFASKFSPMYSWSASRLESYKACPFRFYIDSVLKIKAKEPPKLGLDAAQTGSVYHRVLEVVYMRVKQESVSPLDILDDVAEEVFRNAPNEFDFRPSALWEVEKTELRENLRNTLVELEKIGSGWEPIGFEQKFGIHGSPPLVLDIDGNTVLIRGVIDRLDTNSKGSLRVIDYKSGSSHFSPLDLQNGSRLQLPIYALAAQEALRLGKVVEGFYWSVKDAKASAIKLSSFEYGGIEGPEAAYQIVREHIGEVLVGSKTGHFAPKAPKNGCPEYCPAILWCWRYEAGYKND